MTHTPSTYNQIAYTIQEVARRSGLSIPTLRYYEAMGLLPAVPRDPSSGHRRYPADMLPLIESLANLRSVGMSLDEMHAYVVLRNKGDATAIEKRDLFQAHAAKIEQDIARLQHQHRYLAFKVAYWDARAQGATDEAERIAEDYERIVQALR